MSVDRQSGFKLVNNIFLSGANKRIIYDIRNFFKTFLSRYRTRRPSVTLNPRKKSATGILFLPANCNERI